MPASIPSTLHAPIQDGLDARKADAPPQVLALDPRLARRVRHDLSLDSSNAQAIFKMTASA